MSRTAVKVLMETSPPVAGERPTLRVQRIPTGRGLTGRPLSFEIPRHGQHVVLGPPGAGRSAMMRQIGLARPPERGGIALFGQDLAQVAPSERHVLRRRIGVVFQTPWLANELSALDNLVLASMAIGIGPDLSLPHATQLLAWVGLGRRSGLLAGDLGDEGRRRLAVARAVINRPDLIIADDPTAGGVAAIPRLLRDLHAAGSTLLIATPDEAFAESLGCGVSRISGESAAEGRVA